MNSAYLMNNTNVRLITVFLLFLTLSGCATTGSRVDNTARYCTATQTLMCQSFGSERRCQCGDSARMGRSLTAPGPATW